MLFHVYNVFTTDSYRSNYMSPKIFNKAVKRGKEWLGTPSSEVIGTNNKSNMHTLPKLVGPKMMG